MASQTADRSPDDPQLAIDLAIAHVHADRLDVAAAVLKSSLVRFPDSCNSWLLLGRVHAMLGDDSAALKARYQAVTRAQRAGRWKDESTTPPQLLDAVLEAIDCVRRGRVQLYEGSYDDLRRQYGAAALKRVDQALWGYLHKREWSPPDPRQRPKFLYFPGLPDAPYLDPYLQPWARRLQAAFPVIREEALRLLAEDAPLRDFINFKPGDPVENVLTSSGPRPPSWEAFFFYRHGARFDDNHARCPQTSALLESIELCRIADEAPEICFSVLRPGTKIMPHYGVTNTRVVMHLPLFVPPDCALNLIDADEHHWREGELVMFDDTFKHEAWNRSDATRIILLMDCWNPHLTEVEKLAVKQLIETISGLHLADRPHDERVAGP